MLSWIHHPTHRRIYVPQFLLKIMKFLHFILFSVISPSTHSIQLYLYPSIYDGIFFVSHQAKSGLAGESSAWRKLHRLFLFFFAQQHFYIRQFSFSLVSPCSKDSHSFFISLLLLAPRGEYTCEDEKAQDKVRREKKVTNNNISASKWFAVFPLFHTHFPTIIWASGAGRDERLFSRFWRMNLPPFSSSYVSSCHRESEAWG